MKLDAQQRTALREAIHNGVVNIWCVCLHIEDSDDRFAYAVTFATAKRVTQEFLNVYRDAFVYGAHQDPSLILPLEMQLLAAPEGEVMIEAEDGKQTWLEITRAMLHF